MSNSGESLDVAECLLSLELAASRAGFDGEMLFQIENHLIPVFTRTATSASAPRVYLSAGIHGDEPAGPLAILHLLQDNALRRDIGWTIFPMLNPLGLGIGSRESPQGIDLNRDFASPNSLEISALTKFLARQTPWDMALLLHEDWESTGFYLYVNGPESSVINGRGLLQQISEYQCPVDTSCEIDGMRADHGLVKAEFDKPVVERFLRNSWPEALYLYRKGLAPSQYTLEAPSSFDLTSRVNALSFAVQYLTDPLRLKKEFA